MRRADPDVVHQTLMTNPYPPLVREFGKPIALCLHSLRSVDRPNRNTQTLAKNNMVSMSQPTQSKPPHKYDERDPLKQFSIATVHCSFNEYEDDAVELYDEWVKVTLNQYDPLKETTMWIPDTHVHSVEL